MFSCPKCNRHLLRTKAKQGFFFECPQCRGRAIGLAVLRRVLPHPKTKALWRQASGVAAKTGVACPICQRPTAEVPMRGLQENVVDLDVCTGCRFVWFDAQELKRLPKKRPAPKTELTEEGREAVAMAKLRVDQARERGGDFGTEAPEETWKLLPAILGMPVEHDTLGLRRCPWLTWGITATLVVVTCLTIGHLNIVISGWGLIPNQMWRHGGLTFITSFFLHAGWLHLIGNAYFLVVFGDNVEDYLGRWRYLLLLASAALFGDLLHIFLEPRSEIPSVGASGGISGVIVYYALQFPRARLGMIWWWFYPAFFRWIYAPAYIWMMVWFGMQGLFVYRQLSGEGDVSALAHLGGAAVGFFGWLLWRNR